MKTRPLTDLELEVLAALHGSLGMWCAEVGRLCPNVSESYIYDIVKRLLEWGLVEKAGTHLLSLGRPLQKYRLTGKGIKVVEQDKRQQDLFDASIAA